MFALGKTVAELLTACIDGDSATSAAEVADLVRVLTAEGATDRPRADAAAAHAFFKPLLAFRREQKSECCICMEVARHSDGALCAEGHLTCNQCLDGYVQSCAGEELRKLREREGRVFCPKKVGGLGCGAAAFSDSELGQTVSAQVFESYVKGRMRLLESIVREEVEEEAKRRIEIDQQRLQELDAGQRKVHQPSERDRIAFFRSLICTGTRRNPADCGTNQGNQKDDLPRKVSAQRWPSNLLL